MIMNNSHYLPVGIPFESLRFMVSVYFAIHRLLKRTARLRLCGRLGLLRCRRPCEVRRASIAFGRGRRALK